jgi:ABC-type cobalamin transport system permease subunit
MERVRVGLLVVALVPYLVWAVKDTRMHMGKSKVREVSLAEHLVHLLIFVAVLWMAGGAIQGRPEMAGLGLALFVVPAAVDEAYFHRAIPPTESDAHAKAHLYLFLFMAVAFVMSLVESGVLVLPG